MSKRTFDLITFLEDQIDFSTNTYGPGGTGPRIKGILDHIRKELEEVEEVPTDLEEWIDVILLALDGAWRVGYTPEQITEMLVFKLEKNKRRKWPDWRTVPLDKAIHKNKEAI